MKKRFQLVLRCKACKHRYKRIVMIDEDEAIDDVDDPPCPKCTTKRAPVRTDSYQTASPSIEHDGLEGIIATQSAPGIIGTNPIVRAIDRTAEIVMEDHHLTDLRSDARPGEVMAPKLPPAQQKAADNFFGPKPGQPVNKRQQQKMASMLRRAVGGAYRASALDVKSVLPDARVAMRRVGTEPINR